jgi:predicted nucleic acid-binding protein
MGEGYLLDTNAIIDFCANLLPESGQRLVANIIDTDPTISIINKIELLSHLAIPTAIDTFLKTAFLLSLDDIVAEKTISLRKKHKIKLPDAIIAASAIINKKILVTRNTKDFDRIKELQLLNPYDQSV